MRIVTYRTRHFEFQVPIDEWNEKKIPLPEGAGAQFIAPSDLTAILLEPFWFDYYYETDGRKIKIPAKIYGEEMVGERINLFPWCKDLFKFLDWLKEEYGWCIFADWQPFCEVVVKYVGGSSKKATLAFQRHYNLELSGCVWEGNLEDVGEQGRFWSATKVSDTYAHCFIFDHRNGLFSPFVQSGLRCANSVRCVL